MKKKTEYALLHTAHRLFSDTEFRKSVLSNPRKALADLGLSPEAYEALLSVVLSALVGGGSIILGDPSPKPPLWQ